MEEGAGDFEDRIGEKHGPYTIDDFIGSGNMGDVWLGHLNQYREPFFRRALQKEDLEKDDLDWSIREYRYELTKGLEGHNPVDASKTTLTEEDKAAINAGLDRAAEMYDELPEEEREEHYKDAQEIINSCYRNPDETDGEGYKTVCDRRYSLPNTIRAIKFMKYSVNKKAKRRFEREIRMQRGLDHPNIVKVIEGYVTGDEPYFVMEYVQSINLEEGEIEVRDAVDMVRQALEGLMYLHSRDDPIFHGDIKPHNILVTPDGRVLLSDFGLSKPMHQDKDSRITSSQEVSCTPTFIDPERALGGEDAISPKSDLYSLGATFFNWLTGEFHTGEGRTIFETLFFVITEEKKSFVREHAKGKRVTYRLQDAVAIMLGLDPKNRFKPEEAASELDYLIERDELLYAEQSEPKPETDFSGPELEMAEYYERLGHWYEPDLAGSKNRREAFTNAIKLYGEYKAKNVLSPQEEYNIDMTVSILEKRVALENLREKRLKQLGRERLEKENYEEKSIESEVNLDYQGKSEDFDEEDFENLNLGISESFDLGGIVRTESTKAEEHTEPENGMFSTNLSVYLQGVIDKTKAKEISENENFEVEKAGEVPVEEASIEDEKRLEEETPVEETLVVPTNLQFTRIDDKIKRIVNQESTTVEEQSGEDYVYLDTTKTEEEEKADEVPAGEVSIVEENSEEERVVEEIFCENSGEESENGNFEEENIEREVNTDYQGSSEEKSGNENLGEESL